MSKKIIIFIGEGKSEYAFFEELIKNRYKAKQEKIKSGVLYKTAEAFILFGHPDMRGNSGSGESALVKPITYINVKEKIKGHSYIFGDILEYEISYLIFTDTDTGCLEKKLEKMNECICKFCKDYSGDMVPILAYKEIETWFLVGIGKNFLEYHPSVDKKELQKFYKKRKVDEIDNTKEILLHKVLKNTEIGGSGKQAIIGREFGRLIDVNQAVNISKSFKEVIKTLDILFNHN